MAIFNDLWNNFSILRKQSNVLPVTNQEVGMTQLGSASSPREAVYPQWFFSARLGQPRQVDTNKLRSLARSAWVQMVLNTFKKQVFMTDWDVVVEDEEDETDRTADIKLVKDFLNNINQNGQTINDVASELVTDIGEIDAGVWNLVYSQSSYTIGDVPIHDARGNVIGQEQGLVLKPLGQRKILAVKSVDGSTMLKQVDLYKNLLNYWQYSFKNPRQNPTRFDKEEIVYMMLNPKPYSVYGFSPVQSVQQVLELLIQGTRYNKDLFTNNAIPDLLVSLPKLPKDQLKKLKRSWNNEYKGKAHQVGFINWAIEAFHQLNHTNRDLEWLDGQQWYFKIVFGVFGVSPTEAGFFENSNRSNDEGQERVTVRNALKPYMKLVEQAINRRVINELLQREDHGLKFKYCPKEHSLEKAEFEQDMRELEHGTMTINEFRKKKGREGVEWGDDPLRRPFNPSESFVNFGGPGDNSLTPPANQPRPPQVPPQQEEKSFNPGDDMIIQAESYSEFLEKLFDRMEQKTLSAVNKLPSNKAVNKEIGGFMKDLFNAVNTVAFAKQVKKYLKNDLVKGLSSAESELGIDIGFTDAYEQKLNQLQAQQVDGYNINGRKWPGIKGVTKELQASIVKSVQAGVSENKSLDDISKDIRNVFNNFTEWRSDMIARTETNRVVNEGTMLGYKESGLKGKKVWKTALDDRTSDICKRLNGQVADLDGNFIDPETMKAYSTPPAHPNCRSRIVFRPD